MDFYKRPLSTGLKGPILAVLSAVLFSILNVVIRLSDPYLSIWHMVLGRSIFGVVFIFLMARILKAGLLGRRKGLLFLLGSAGTLGVLCLMTALIQVPLFQALILFYTYPVIAALISPWLTRDKNNLLDWFFIFLAFLGTGIILWPGEANEIVLELGHFLALAAAFCFGLSLTLVRKVSAENNPLIPIFYICGIGAVLSILPFFSSKVNLLVSSKGILGMAAIGILSSAAHMAGNKALSYISSPKVGIVSMLEVVFGAICGYLLFSEALGWSAFLGGGLILGSSFGLNRPRS